jgi:signal peptidase I
MMSVLTAALYGVLLFYGAGWWLGYWVGNFSLLLFVLTLVTLAYWLAERFRFAPARAAAADALATQDTNRRAELKKLGLAQADSNGVESARESLLMQPWWLDWTAGLFPVIAVVFVLRSFLFEPFKIPSGSMIPTLLVGDLILVNKFHYGIRLPVLGTKLVSNKEPQRGDVMVFRYPVDPRIDYIKRVVGLPGDEVVYNNKSLSINGKPVPVQAQGDFYDEDSLRFEPKFAETLGNIKHGILVEPRRASIYRPMDSFVNFRENCQYTIEGVSCKVPAGHYFMMGDNRDNSQDSRFWGFVPDENIVGRAFMVWMNFSNLRRVGLFD